MKKLLFLLIMALPLTAAAQYFTPDLPEKRGLYLFVNPNTSSMHHDWMIMPGEKMRVDSLHADGWCLINYVNKEGKEYVGYNKIKMLKPLDDVATAMKGTAVAGKAKEQQVIRWGIVLLAAGLVVWLMKFLGRMRVALQSIIFCLLCALEIWFLYSTPGGFQFYSPFSVGWKWAVIWFIVYLAFIAVQFFLFVKTVVPVSDSFTSKTAKEAYGTAGAITLMSLLAAFIALFLCLFWPAIQQYIGIGVTGVILVCGVVLFIGTAVKEGIGKAVLLAPTFTLGWMALAWMLYDAAIAGICIMLVFMLMQTMLKGGSKGGTILDDMGSKKRSAQEDHYARRNVGDTSTNSSPI
jgi:hypothetical protein